MSMIKHKEIRPVPAHSSPAVAMAHRHWCCAASWLKPVLSLSLSLSQTLLEPFSMAQTKWGRSLCCLCVHLHWTELRTEFSVCHWDCCSFTAWCWEMQLFTLSQELFPKVVKSYFAGNKLDNIHPSKMHKDWIIKSCICHSFITNIIIINYFHLSFESAFQLLGLQSVL